jgi:glycerol-1-phosphate dehydrogenase [NAD(P)+]
VAQPPSTMGIRIPKTTASIAFCIALWIRACWAELAAKRLDRDAADRLSAALAGSWEAWRERLLGVTRPAAVLRDVLRRAGAPTTPEEFGCSRPLYREAVSRARLIRSRFTFLDLAADAGILDGFVKELPVER